MTGNDQPREMPKGRKFFDGNKHTGMQLAGFVLWRFGLLLAGATALYNGIEILLRWIRLPIQLEIGIGLVIAGMITVMVSFVMERIADMQTEGDLSQ